MNVSYISNYEKMPQWCLRADTFRAPDSGYGRNIHVLSTHIYHMRYPYIL